MKKPVNLSSVHGGQAGWKQNKRYEIRGDNNKSRHIHTAEPNHA
jgi:hypothetical protein